MTRKRLLSFVMVLCMLFACKEVFAEPKKLLIVTSFYPVYIMALNVADGIADVKVDNLTSSATGCLHDYALTPQEMKKLEKADIFIVNGAGMESFLERVAQQYPKLKIVQLSSGIKRIKDIHGQDNPHVWVSVSSAITEVKNLGQALEEFDSAHQQTYRRNTVLYCGKLEVLRATMQQALAPYKRSKIITFHEAFPYFAQEFGLDIAAVVEREPGSSPSAQELAETIAMVKKNHIKALFGEPQYPTQSAETIARETGLPVYVLDPAVTGSNDKDAYISIMINNLAILKRALQ